MLEKIQSTPPPQRHDPVLCFVRLPCAYFSFVPCDDPRLLAVLDGWHEPHEDDAGNPAGPGQVLRVAFTAGTMGNPIRRPLKAQAVSPSAINTSRGGWLLTPDGDVVAHAGMPLSAFREVMRARGEEVFEPTWPGRPAFDPSEPAKGSPRVLVQEAVRRPAENVEVLLESVFKEVGLDIRVARYDMSDVTANVPDVAQCRLVVYGHGGNLTLDPYSAAVFVVGLSRFIARSKFDWSRLDANACAGKTVGYTIDGLEAHVISTADPVENARRLAAAWNEAAGYGPGEGAWAVGTQVIWPETTKHPVHARAAAAPAETTEPPKEEEAAEAKDIFERDPIAADARNVAQTRHDLTVFYPAVFLKEPLFLQDVLDHPAMSDKKGVVFYYVDKGIHYRIIAERVVPPVSPPQVTNLALEQQMVQACGEEGAAEVVARIAAATSRQEGDGSCSES